MPVHVLFDAFVHIVFLHNSRNQSDPAPTSTSSIPGRLTTRIKDSKFVCLFVWFLKVLINYNVISRTGPKTERLTNLSVATHETELGDHDFCLSRSHYTDTDPTHQESRALPTELPRRPGLKELI